MRISTAGLATVAWLVAVNATAQTPVSGDVSVFADYFPNRTRTVESRARVFAEKVLDPAPNVLITLSGFAEGLFARRPAGARGGEPSAVGDAIVRVQQASVDLKGERASLFIGFGRAVWGRLDEVQPTDVVNPIDVSRFFFEGRSQARLPVALLCARVFLSEKASIEGVYVPRFRRGRFDQLDEPTSPFNIVGSSAAAGADRQTPAISLKNAQGGARFNATTGRVDWSLSAYRGFEPFGLYTLRASVPGELPAIVETFPRFVMVGGDFETARGKWGVRGEVAGFVRDNFQDRRPRIATGSSIDAGGGVDRKAGDYRVSGIVLIHRESYDALIEGSQSGRTDVSLVLSADRSFARERYQARLFGVANPSERSGFVRGIATAHLRDNVAVELSAGWFIGQGRDLVGRFSDSDFGYVRLKYYF
jgi:hypothetical protein